MTLEKFNSNTFLFLVTKCGDLNGFNFHVKFKLLLQFKFCTFRCKLVIGAPFVADHATKTESSFCTKTVTKTLLLH